MLHVIFATSEDPSYETNLSTKISDSFSGAFRSIRSLTNLAGDVTWVELAYLYCNAPHVPCCLYPYKTCAWCLLSPVFLLDDLGEEDTYY